MRTLILASAGIAALLGSTFAEAADVSADAAPEATPPASEWTFSVAPYLWGAGLEGDIGLFGREPINVDLSFGDIFDNLRFGGMVVAELHNGTWGVFGDLVYVNIEADGSITGEVGGVPVTLSGGVTTSSLTATLMGEYRALATSEATVDLMAGARIWSVDNDIEVALSAGDVPLAAFSGNDGSTWLDPIVGVKARYDFNSSWYLTGWGMIGGFGAGSDITWDVLGGVGYQWSDRFSIVAGYRALAVDYEDDGFVYDVIQQGPILGAVIRF